MDTKEATTYPESKETITTATNATMDTAAAESNPTKKSTGRKYTVGQVAKRSGVTVRALHHYDSLGLLPPCESTKAGYRLYDENSLQRLQHILLLKQLGFTLEHIRSQLNSESPPSLADTINRRIRELAREIESQNHLLAKLQHLQGVAEGPEPNDSELFETMEMMTMIDKYYTPQDIETLQTSRKQIGEDRYREAQDKWADLLNKVQIAYETGKPPSSPEVVGYAKQWQELLRIFTGGDESALRTLETMYKNEPVLREKWGVPLELSQYVKEAMNFIELSHQATDRSMAGAH